MDNGKTLGFKGDKEVRYADVCSGGESMTMVLRLSVRGIEIPFMIFQNKGRNYPIRGVPDDVPGVIYRTGPKGWMDRKVMVMYLEEPHNLQPLDNNVKRNLWADNCNGHAETEEVTQALERSNTDLNFLPANTTRWTQPADSFVIAKVKQA